jgi:APA family basic amino acid/polyamine antiporter
MACDEVFLPAAASAHPRYGTPARAITLRALLASTLVIIGNVEEIISYFIFVVVIFLALTVASIFVLRRARPAAVACMTPGYPVTPFIFLLLIAPLLLLLGVNQPTHSFLGVAVVALALPFYYLVFCRGAAQQGRNYTNDLDQDHSIR